MRLKTNSIEKGVFRKETPFALWPSECGSKFMAEFFDGKTNSRLVFNTDKIAVFRPKGPKQCSIKDEDPHSL